MAEGVRVEFDRYKGFADGTGGIASARVFLEPSGIEMVIEDIEIRRVGDPRDDAYNRRLFHMLWVHFPPSVYFWSSEDRNALARAVVDSCRENADEDEEEFLCSGVNVNHFVR